MARIKLEDDKGEDTKKSSPGGLYFGRPNTTLQFISSGCKLLDLALGGGWARRRIANIVGNRSSGKCVRNATIITNNGFESIDSIGDLKPYGQSDWDQKLSLESLKNVKTSHFWKESVEKTVTIKTRHGFEIEGTVDHKVLVWTKSCHFEMKPLSTLLLGDVAVISKSPWYPVCNYSLPTIPSKKERDWVSKEIVVPTTMTACFAELLGFYVADGNTAGRNLQFSNTKPWFSQRFLRDVKKVFGISKQDVGVIAGESGGFVISRTRLFDFFNVLFDNQLKTLTARFKYVPECVLKSSKDCQAAFLRGLIDCDSWSMGNEIVYSTASKKLAQQVHLMLLNFGVVSSKQPKPGPGIYSDHTYWDISIHGKFAKLYNDIIGYNRRKLTVKGEEKSDFDSIPYLLEKFNQDVLELRERVGWSRNGTTSIGRLPYFQFNSKNLTFNSVAKIVDKYTKYDTYFDLSVYRTLLTCNYHFDPIETIETSKQVVDVFDVHIPSEHKFWANGFINHNTLLAIEASANFAFSEPKGKIRYREAESAFDEQYAQALGFPLDRVDFGEPLETVEDLFEDLTKVVADAKGPELYIIDSLDALSDRSEMERDIDQGSFGAEKAKKLSQLFRRLVSKLSGKDVTLIIVSQVRDNVGGAMFAKKHVRSGGRALDFYASQVVMLQEIKKLKRTISNVERVVGIEVKAVLEKNKVALPFREAEFPIMFGYGIDDCRACEMWLKQVGVAFKKEDSVDDLRRMVEDKWWAIEQKFLPTTSKYS